MKNKTLTLSAVMPMQIGIPSSKRNRGMLTFVSMTAMMLCMISILLTSYKTNAQPTFQKLYGGIKKEYALEITPLSNGGSIIVGHGRDSNNSTDVSLIKIDADGTLIWSKLYGTPMTSDVGYSVKQTFDGGYIICGTIFGVGAGDTDVLLMKTDSMGNIQWTKSIGGPSQEYGYYIQQTPDSGYVIAGCTMSFGAGGWDIYLINTNKTGDTLWTKTYGTAMMDIAYSVFNIPGGFILFGVTGTGFSFAIKTNTNGNIQSKHMYRITSEVGYFGLPTNDGGYVITGKSAIGIGISNIFLIKADSTGNIEWGRTYDSGAIGYGFSVRQTSDDGYIIGGYLDGGGAGLYDAHLIRTNESGHLLWTSTFGTPNYEAIQCALETNDGGYISCGGWNITFSPSGNSDVYLLKTDSTGLSGCNGMTIYTTDSSHAVTHTTTSLMTSYGGIINIPILTINNLDTSNTLCSNVGINDLIEFQNKDAIIFPNPFTTTATIKFSSPLHSATFRLYNLFGQKIMETSGITGESFRINAETLGSGVYVYEVMEKGKKICGGKAVVY